MRWGVGSLDCLRADLEELGARRALVLTTRSLARSVAPMVEAALGAICVGSCAGLAAHVPASGVAAATDAVAAADADAIVSVGGGSVIDAAKAVLVAAAAGGRRLRHAAVPTTLSGSEYSHFYGVTEDSFKQSFIEADSVPEIVVLDPMATESTPIDLWNGSGMKALDHAVEAVRAPGERPIGDPLALIGIREVATALEWSAVSGSSEARLQAQIGAWHCYFAPANATLGLSHRIGHILGGTYGVPHAATSSITLPAVLRATEGLRPRADEAIAMALTPEGSAARPRSSPAEALTAIARRLELPSRLSEVGVATKELPRISALLRERYRPNVDELGPEADERLDRLLISIA